MLVTLALLAVAQQPIAVLDQTTVGIQPAPGGDVLVLSDGLSRGAYQAGVLAAHLRGARDTGRLVRGLVGSSVGAINALLGAVEWCATSTSRESTSVLWRAWANAEWRDLLPGRETCADYDARNPDMRAVCTAGRPYGESEALFTTNALGGVRAEILRAFTQLDYFEKGCAVRLGVTLASELPAPIGAAFGRGAPGAPPRGCDEGGQVVCTRRRKVMVDLRVSSEGRARFCAVSGPGSRVLDAALTIEPPRVRVVPRSARDVTADRYARIAFGELPALTAAYRASAGQRRIDLGAELAGLVFFVAEGLDASSHAAEDVGRRDRALDELGRAWTALDPAHRVIGARSAAVETLSADRDDLPCDEVDPTWVVDATIASVNIPFGSRPHGLRFCGLDCTRATNAGGECPADLSMCTERFTQATIVDRLPLTLGLQVSGPASTWAPSVVLMDPKRNPVPVDALTDGLEKARGSAFYRALFAHWVDTADDLELQRLHRAGQLRHVHLVQPAHRSPIVGELMLGTGAYVHRRYRQHDFGAGLLDWVAWWNDVSATDVDDARWPVEPSMEGTIAGLKRQRAFRATTPIDPDLAGAGQDALIAWMIDAVLRNQPRFAGERGVGADPDRWPFGDFIDFSNDLREALDSEAVRALETRVRHDDPVRADELGQALAQLRVERSVVDPDRWLANEASRLADRMVEVEEGSTFATLVKLYSRLHPDYRDDDAVHVGGDSFDGTSWVMGLILPEQIGTRLVLDTVTHESESQLQWRWLMADVGPLRLATGPVLHFQRSPGRDDIYQLGPQLDLSYRLRWFIVPDVGVRGRALFDMGGDSATDLDGSVFLRLFSGVIELSFGYVPTRDVRYVGLGLGRVAEITYWLGSVIVD